jgi:D-alanine-D-alanine ligase
MSKKIFEHEGVPTPEWFSVLGEESHDISSVGVKIESGFGFPCVVKPNDQGSTVGLTVVEQKIELKKAIDCAAEYSAHILVEKFISGRELTVGVLGEVPLPVVEIIPEHGIYDYHCKYTHGKSKYVCPAEIPDQKAKEIQTLGLKAFQSLGCEGYARVDFRYGEDDKFYCLEVNTLPGMTSLSLVPMAAKALGIDFPQLVDKIASLALDKKSV